MYPFVPVELGEAFDLGEVLRFGSIPLVWASQDRTATLQAYVQMYLREEIQTEALVRNLPGFVRFLPVAALFHSQVVNVSSIARDAGAARSTVNGYLEILEDTLLARRLPAYEARLRVRERKHPKLYWVDPGLVRAVKKQRGPLAVEERGPLVEGWVFTVLSAYAEARELYDEVYYWSSTQGKRIEVDFLLQRGGEFLALEVKTQRRFSPQLLAGLQAIGELPGVVRRLLLYGGELELTSPEGIEVWPLPRWLEALERGTLWP
jgi:predicted AAA+ superfamily ATPase